MGNYRMKAAIIHRIEKSCNGAIFLNKKDIIRLTGQSRAHVDRLTAGLPHAGGKTTFFIDDVAEAFIRNGYKYD